jgi:glutathione S-transferase
VLDGEIRVITLYGVAGPNVAKTRASLLRKKLGFEHVAVDLINQSDEFRQLTPIGRVPVISDNGLIVHDSLFIAEYLDRQYPDLPRLLPEELPLRVKAYTIFALLERLFTIASPIVATTLGFFDLVDQARAACSGYYPTKKPLRAKLKAALTEKIQTLAAMLEDGNYFTGRACMQPDFAVFAFMTLLSQIGIAAGPLDDWMTKRKSEFPFSEMFATDDVAVSRTI